jgi:integrase
MKRRPLMVTLAQEYLASRRKLGLALKVEGMQLLAFAQYADRVRHRGPVTTELALRWAKLPQDASPEYWSRRLGIVRRFAKYRLLFDPATEIPPEHLLGPACRRPSPYIYSEGEIAALMQACRRLGPAGGLRPSTYATFFGLLASTGLRSAEALRLTGADVDLSAGMLCVSETKFHKSRLVPLHSSTVRALRAYVARRHHRHPLSREQAFFLTEKGTALKYGRMFATFNYLRRILGWQKTSAPRIHDLRHTFAVRRLLAWYQAGVEIDQKIPALSTYLGHVRVRDTYWYLTAVPALLAIASARCEREFSRRKRP